MRVIKIIVLSMVSMGLCLTSSQAKNYSISFQFIQAVKDQRIHEIKIAVENGVNVNARDYDHNTTALIIVTKKKNTSLVDYLIKNGAKPDLYDDDGKTPLLIASDGGNRAVVDLLIKAGADLNIADKNGTTPLMAAVVARRNGIVKLLLEAGADYNLEDYSGRSALQHAIDHKRRQAEKLLRAAIIR